MIACLVDAARMAVYWHTFFSSEFRVHAAGLSAVVASAWIGTWLGARWLRAVTRRGVRALVTIGVIAVALGLGTGLL